MLSESRGRGPPEKAGTVVGLETGMLPKIEKKGSRETPSFILLPILQSLASASRWLNPFGS